jgi:hypothetical protein
MRVALERRDYAAALLALWKTRIRIAVAAVPILALAGFARTWIVFQGPSVPPHLHAPSAMWLWPLMLNLLPAIVLGAFLLFLVFVYVPVRAGLFYSHQKRQPDYDMSFDSEALSWKSAKGGGRLAWTSFLRWAETGDVFVLFRSKTTFQIIPKRAFANGADIAAFRDVLKKGIAGKAAG